MATHRWSKYGPGHLFDRPTHSRRSDDVIKCGVCDIVFGFMTNDDKMNDAIDLQLKHYDSDEHEIMRRRKFGLPPLICQLCHTDEYATQTELDKHCQLKSHKIKENRWKGTVIGCEVCPNFEGGDQKHLEEHRLTKAHIARMRDPYECKFCPWFKPTKNLAHWKIHLKSKGHAVTAGICLPAKPKNIHHCELCNKGFDRRANYKRHLKSRTHQFNEMKYKIKTLVV